MTSPRHAWGAPTRFPLKTERVCARCGTVKVTRHDAGPTQMPWLEFWRDGSKFEAKGTPRCDAEIRRLSSILRPLESE